MSAMSSKHQGVMATEGASRSRALESVRVCGTCYELYEDRASGGRPRAQRCSCRKVEGEETWQDYDFNEWVRLCDCCGQIVLNSGSRYSGWFCPACRTEVMAYNQEVGRVVVPLGRHSFVNGTTVPARLAVDDEEGWVDAVVRMIQSLQGGIDLLERAKRRRMKWNLGELEMQDRESVGLIEYLQACGDNMMEHEDEVSLAMDGLVGEFAEALIDPVDNPPPDLQERIESAARTFVASLPAAKIEEALAEGPNAVHRLGFQWAFVDGSRLIYPESCRTGSGVVMMKLAPVVNALSEAVAERIRVVWGTPETPRLPEATEDLEVGASSESPNDRRRIARGAHHVISTEQGGCGTTCGEDYYLTRSADQREWVLWCGYDDDELGRYVYGRVGACRRRGVSKEDAACLMIEARWVAMRDAWEQGAPGITSAGLVTSDQAFALLDRVWPDA